MPCYAVNGTLFLLVSYIYIHTLIPCKGIFGSWHDGLRYVPGWESSFTTATHMHGGYLTVNSQVQVSWDWADVKFSNLNSQRLQLLPRHGYLCELNEAVLNHNYLWELINKEISKQINWDEPNTSWSLVWIYLGMKREMRLTRQPYTTTNIRPQLTRIHSEHRVTGWQNGAPEYRTFQLSFKRLNGNGLVFLLISLAWPWYQTGVAKVSSNRTLAVF